MELKKTEIQILKAHGEVLEVMFSRRINELKEVLYKTEPEDGKEIRGRARELDYWRGIIRELTKISKKLEVDKGI